MSSGVCLLSVSLCKAQGSVHTVAGTLGPFSPTWFHTRLDVVLDAGCKVNKSAVAYLIEDEGLVSINYMEDVVVLLLGREVAKVTSDNGIQNYRETCYNFTRSRFRGITITG